MNRKIILSTLLALSIPVSAESSTKVYFYPNTDGIRGEGFVNYLRDKIRSTSYLTLDEETSGTGIRLKVSTFDLPNQIGYTAIFVWDNMDPEVSIYLNSQTGRCNPEYLESCTKGILRELKIISGP